MVIIIKEENLNRMSYFLYRSVNNLNRTFSVFMYSMEEPRIESGKFRSAGSHQKIVINFEGNSP